MRKLFLAASFATLMTAPAVAQVTEPFQTNASIQVINAPAAYAKGFDGTGVLRGCCAIEALSSYSP